MIDGLDDRLNSFLENKTYTWLKDIFQFNFNGYIKQIEELRFLFIDDELGEIWINKRDITFISYCKKEVRE
jgi:hypothetical protein